MNNERINDKLVRLNEILFELDKISKMDKKDFYKSKIYIEASENYLRKALQTVIDLACDLVSKNRLGISSSYYETFEILVENSMLDKENLSLYKKMVGMRNRLVHDYDRISKEVLFNVIKENLNDFNVAIDDFKRNYN